VLIDDPATLLHDAVDGFGQLELSGKPNARRQGRGLSLVEPIEREALSLGMRIVLDTADGMVMAAVNATLVDT
jgi:hypothetical protein